VERTIAAISTGRTPAGISIIRLSGTDALFIASKVFRGRVSVSHMKSHHLYHGFIFDGEHDIDEVLLSYMKGPHSFTGEDIIEINSHGGVFVAEKILDLLIQQGASVAEPGEFTKRAFLNGRLDLSQAEAVIDVIDAQNDFAIKASVSQLKGRLSVKIQEIRNQLLDEISFIEAALDDPEHYDLTGHGEVLWKKVNVFSEEVNHLLKNSENGSILTHGIRTCIAGRPNAGKSSLLNLLAGTEKAIVTDIAGTTRDVLEVPVRLGSFSMLLSDTAGIRETQDLVEKIGVDRAYEAMNQADLVLYLIDCTQEVEEEDIHILQELSSKKQIIILNKIDLGFEEKLQKLSDLLQAQFPSAILLPFSTKSENSLKQLISILEHLYQTNEIMENDELFLTNARERECLKEASSSLSLVLEGIEAGMPEDVLTIDLVNAYTALGKIIGEEVDDDVIDRVFEKFCMGK